MSTKEAIRSHYLEQLGYVPFFIENTLDEFDEDEDGMYFNYEIEEGQHKKVYKTQENFIDWAHTVADGIVKEFLGVRSASRKYHESWEY